MKIDSLIEALTDDTGIDLIINLNQNQIDKMEDGLEGKVIFYHKLKKDISIFKEEPKGDFFMHLEHYPAGSSFKDAKGYRLSVSKESCAILKNQGLVYTTLVRDPRIESIRIEIYNTDHQEIY